MLPPCGLRLPPTPSRRVGVQNSSRRSCCPAAVGRPAGPLHAVPRERDRFARLYSDVHRHVLGVAFYRPSGVLQSATDATYAATPGSETGSDVKCDSSSQATIGKAYWRTTRKWSIGATAPGMNRDKVVQAVRNAQAQWTNNTNWCGIKDQANPPAHYEGSTSRSAKHDGYSTVDWGSLAQKPIVQRGARLHVHRLRREGQPGRNGHPVQHGGEMVDLRRRRKLRHPIRRRPRNRPRPPIRSRHELLQTRPHSPDVALHGHRRHLRSQARPRRRAPRTTPTTEPTRTPSAPHKAAGRKGPRGQTLGA